MAKQQNADKATQEQETDYSFRDLERTYKRNVKAIESLASLPGDQPAIKTAIAELMKNNELIKKRAYKMVDEKFGSA